MWGGGSHYGIAHVTGRPNAGSYTDGAPMRVSQITHASNKIIDFEYSGYGNRPLSNVRAFWHNKNDRRYVTLWGDGHVTWHLFPISIESSASVAADPNGVYW